MQELTEEEVVQDYYGLVVHLAKPYMQHYEYDDLVNEGLIAVLMAFRKYDPSAGASFGTFTGQQIKFALGKYARKSRTGFHVPHEAERNRRLIVKNKLEELPLDEIATCLGITAHAAKNAMTAYRLKAMTSTDILLSNGETENQTVGDMVKHYDDLSHIDVVLFLKKLTDRERYIIERIAAEVGQREIAKELGTHQVKISRELKAIKDKYAKWEEIS